MSFSLEGRFWYATAQHPTGPSSQPGPSLDDPALYINRELSWLEFNRRVLEEAQDADGAACWNGSSSWPSSSRTSTSSSWSASAACSRRCRPASPFGSGADRMPPAEQLERIGQVVRQMMPSSLPLSAATKCCPPWKREGIVLRGAQGPDRQRTASISATSFGARSFPVLTPLAIDPGHPFPHLLNKSLNLAVVLQRPAHDEEAVRRRAGAGRAAALRCSCRPTKGHVFTPLETVIRLHLPELFPGMELDHATVFRVTRNSEYEIDDDEVEDLLKTIEEEVRKRRRGIGRPAGDRSRTLGRDRAVPDEGPRPRPGRRLSACPACST